METSAVTPSSLSEDEIVGIVVGIIVCIAVLVVVIIVIVCCQRKRRNRQTVYLPEDRSNCIRNDSTSSPYVTNRFNSKSEYTSAKDNSSQHNKTFANLDASQLKHSDSVNKRSGYQRSVSSEGRSHLDSVVINTSDLKSTTTVTSYVGQNSVPSRVNGGIDNPCFTGDEDSGNHRKGDTSHHLSVSSHAESSGTLERRRHRMDSQLAAIIAAERDRNTSVFNVIDSDSFVEGDSVIISDQRTAL